MDDANHIIETVTRWIGCAVLWLCLVALAVGLVAFCVLVYVIATFDPPSIMSF